MIKEKQKIINYYYLEDEEKESLRNQINDNTTNK